MHAIFLLFNSMTPLNFDRSEVESDRFIIFIKASVSLFILFQSLKHIFIYLSSSNILSYWSLLTYSFIRATYSRLFIINILIISLLDRDLSYLINQRMDQGK